jgi:hypothetical protein
MRIPGKRFKRTRLVQTAEYVVAVEVEMVVPEDFLCEPCYESETVEFLREVAERADRGEIDWIKAHGKVYRAVDAA